MSDEPGKPARRRPALSPSRAADFKQCPLLYRFRAIDRLPEPPSTAQVRGSVVHAALEQLYGLPAAQRGPQTVDALVGPAWEQVIAAEPELADQLDAEQQTHLLDEARKLLSGYYSLEDPTRFDPQSCEQRIEVELADGTLLRGIIDRIDVAPTGELRVVDYKTGKAPPEARALAEFKAMFQMKFYAVALLRSRGVLPTRLRLIYLVGRPAAGLLPRRSRAAALREDADGDLARHSIRRCHRRFQATAVAAVRLVRAPRALSGLRRHTAAVPGLAGGSRRRQRRHRPAAQGRAGCLIAGYCSGDISCSIVGISSLTVG